MRSQPLDATRLLELWEVTGGLDAVERALALAVEGGQAREDLLDRPYGATNAAVWAFRTQWLGSHLNGLATCASCGERVEFAVDGSDLPAPDRVDATGEVPGGRLPTPSDLLRAAAAPDPGGALRTSVLHDPAVTGDALAVVEDALATADPWAELLLDLTCPACGTSFRADLDLGAFVAGEVEAYAVRLLHEVDLLARTYGWGEAEILGLSASRRAAYLGLVTEGAP
jgi:hypothetical protein